MPHLPRRFRSLSSLTTKSRRHEVPSAAADNSTDQPISVVPLFQDADLPTSPRITGITSCVRVLVFGLLCLLLLPGCVARPTTPTPYTGPTDPLPVLVNKINQNNHKLATLFANAYIEANIVHQGKTRFVNTEGDLFVRKPRELLLRGRKVFDKVFEIGSTPDRYWLSIYLDENTRRWGYYRNVAKTPSDAIAIRPDLIGQVLGISDINTDLLQPPIPTMTFNTDIRVYMVEWHWPLGDGWFTEKAIWYDLTTHLPRKVIVFDTHGRPVLRANLSKHQPVQSPNLPRDQWPLIATVLDLYFPETGSYMTLKLSDPALSNQSGNPKEGSLIWRDDPALKEIQIDEPISK